jgi:AcrR family transcriptional regulator
MTTRAANTVKVNAQRRAALLDAALTVFARYGYRKASMDEIARSAGVSRQGLYLHFADKEELFRASVGHHYAQALDAALAALVDKERSIDHRLAAAFDEWLGRYVGVMGVGAWELIADTEQLTGSIMAEHEKRFEQAVAKAIAASPLMGVYAPAGLTALQLARTLHATARGLKDTAVSRGSFAESLATAVRVISAPLLRTPDRARRSNKEDHDERR